MEAAASAGEEGASGGAGQARGGHEGREPMLAGRLTRRQVLLGAAGGLVVGGVGGLIGYEWPRTSRSSRASAAQSGRGTGITGAAALRPQLLAFVTRPELRPPAVNVTVRASQPSTPRYFVLSPRTYVEGTPGQHGLMLVDREGRLVWFQPLGPQPFDLAVQSYQGRPVLTWWQGTVVYTYGQGTGEIAGSRYQGLQKIQAGNGLKADLHELQLTRAGTALLTAYQTVEADFSSFGGRGKGKLIVGHAQEVDLASGKVLWDWDSLDHVGVEESYKKTPQPGGEYDYFHINSIAEMPDGHLLISARNTWAVYKVDRSTGRIIWRLGGKRSDFTLGPGARFYWQHDARPHGPTRISLFDDGALPAEERQSRGLLLHVDTKAMRVSVHQEYLQPAGFLAANQGSVQVLPDGRVFVGWGNQPYFSEFEPNGELLLTGELPFGYHSYRAFTQDWHGAPLEPPAVAALGDPGGGTQVFASWNGATEVERWLVLAGEERTSLRPVGSQQWSGFETSLSVNAAGPWFAAVALDHAGKELGRSQPVQVGQRSTA